MGSDAGNDGSHEDDAMTGARPGGEVVRMTTNSKTTAIAREKSPGFQIGQFLFLVGLAVAVFLLGLSMVHHRFVQGGRIDRYGHIKR